MEKTLELETKIFNTKHTDYESILLELWAKKIFDGILKTVKFKKPGGKKIFIRYNKKIVQIIQKEKVNCNEDWIKARNEKTFEYKKDFDYLKEYYLNKWYNIFSETIKERVSFILNDKNLGVVRFDFDKYLEVYDLRLWKENSNLTIPEFLEIESSNIDIILKYLLILGFDLDDCNSSDGKDFLLHYIKNK